MNNPANGWSSQSQSVFTQHATDKLRPLPIFEIVEGSYDAALGYSVALRLTYEVLIDERTLAQDNWATEVYELYNDLAAVLHQTAQLLKSATEKE